VALAETVTLLPTVTTTPFSGALTATVGAAAATFTVMALEVTVVPLESVADAVRVVAPAAAGVHATVYGAVFTVPSAVGTPPTVAVKETDWIVAPAIGVAEAVTVVAVPTVPDELFAGEVNATEVAVTAVTATPADVAELPFVSVTRAVSVALPAAVGVHAAEYDVVPGAPATVAMTVAPERNCTWATVAPPEPGATFAVSVVAEPTVTTAPVDGAVSAAVGRELPAVAATAADVIVLPNESSATAVSVYAPATAGVHATV